MDSATKSIKHRKPTLVVNDTSYPQSQNANSSGVVGRESSVKSLGDALYATYKLIRPHSLIGAALSIISIFLLAVQNLSDLTPSVLLRVLQATLGACFVTIYTAGINQLSDIEIDKVNKPYLPLASGEFSVKTGVLLTSLFASLSFYIGWSIQSPPLRFALFVWFLCSTAYSVNLPLLRWKRDPVLTALTMSIGYGMIIPISFYLDAQTYLNNGGPLELSKHIIFVSGFMTIFLIVIALFKDIPDVEGDKKDGVNSFAIQFGEERVFWISIWLLEMAYGMAILIGLLSTGQFWIRSIMVTSHSIFGYMVWTHAKLVDIKSPKATGSFYLFIWKLYYMEYLLVPILRF